jgi:hypothetical protein
VFDAISVLVTPIKVRERQKGKWGGVVRDTAIYGEGD